MNESALPPIVSRPVEYPELTRRDLLRLTAGGAGALALSGGAQLTRPGPARAAGQASLRWDKPSTLHPLFSGKGTEQAAERLIFGTLVKMNDKLEPVPDLAESVEPSADATSYTFTLRPGLTFSDGAPLTTRDVVFTIERAVDQRTASIWRGRLLGIAGAREYGAGEADSISGLEALDDRTLRVTLAAPDASFQVVLGNFTGLGILPSHVLGEIPPDQLAQHPFSLAPTVGGGPFAFERYETDQYLELRRNDAWGGGSPAVLDRLFLRILTSEVGIAQLESGELDVMEIPAAEAERLRDMEHLVVTGVASPSTARIVPNLDRPHFQDKRVRQAMAYAIDRPGIINAVLRGEAELINSPIIGPDWMGVPEGLNEYSYDPDMARQLLAEANWDSGQEFEIMIQQTGDRTQETYAAIIQQQLKEVGINLLLMPLDTPEFSRRLVQESDFDIAFGLGGVFRADPNVSANFFETVNFTPSGANHAHYSNPTVDELYQAGRATTDQEQRRQIYTQLAQLLNDEQPWIFLWSPNAIYAQNRRLVNFMPPSYFGNLVWNAEEWTVAE